jgi:hypothetical protein
VTKSSTTRIERRLKCKPKGGRPEGTFRSLLDDPQCYSIAAWLLFEPLFGPHVAARLAIITIDETGPIEIGRVEGLLTMLSAEYKPPPGAPGADFDVQASSLAAKAKLTASRASAAEFDWLIESSAYLRGLIGFVASGNWTGVREAHRLLLERGWGNVLARFTRRPDLSDVGKSIDQSRLRAVGRRLLAASRPVEVPKS